MTAGLTTPVGANGAPLDVVGHITMPVSIGNFTTEQVFVVVNALTMYYLLGADYLVAHGVIIDYKRGCVVIKDNEILLRIISDLSMCNRIIYVLNTITIPDHAVQLLDVNLPDEATKMGLSNIMVESGTATNIPKHVLVARTFSPVCIGNHIHLSAI